MTKPYVVLVTGSRNYTDRGRLREAIIDATKRTDKNVVVIQGGATGADRLAKLICKEEGIYCATLDALWDSLGRSAGVLRNQMMIDLVEVDEAIACPLPTSRGTFDMMDRLKRAGIPTTNLTGVEKTAAGFRSGEIR